MILINRIIPKIFRINILSENKKNNNIHITIFLIFVMTIFILYLIYLNKIKKREGITGKINQAIRDIRDVGNKVKKIPKDVENVGRKIEKIPRDVENEFKNIERKTTNEINKVTSAVDDGIKKIEEEGKKIIDLIEDKCKEYVDIIKDAVTNKLTRFFESLGEELKRAFYDPVEVLFNAIGQVFILLGEIFQLIIDKIISLPDCVPYYSLSAGQGMTKGFLPPWLYKTIMFIHRMWLWFLNLIHPLLKMIGIDIKAWQRAIDNKCYKFPVGGKLDRKEREMDEAGQNFLDNFGRVDFNNIEV